MSNEKRLWIIEAKDGAWGANGICKGELVRCGECKWFDREAFCESKSYGSCKLPLSHINTHCMIPEDYYCADGERKDGERDV